jgi:hypothetical protein
MNVRCFERRMTYCFMIVHVFVMSLFVCNLFTYGFIDYLWDYEYKFSANIPKYSNQNTHDIMSV